MPLLCPNLSKKVGQGMKSLARFPKGETLWWAWAKPNPLRRSIFSKRANSPKGYEASDGRNFAGVF